MIANNNVVEDINPHNSAHLSQPLRQPDVVI